eukprot:1149689-Pelagomonas_calceolata.AAC.1
MHAIKANFGLIPHDVHRNMRNWLYPSGKIPRTQQRLPRQEKKNYVGRSLEETLPTSIRKKGDTLAQKSRESPPPQSTKLKSAHGDLEGKWKHPAPKPGCEKYDCFQ